MNRTELVARAAMAYRTASSSGCVSYDAIDAALTASGIDSLMADNERLRAALERLFTRHGDYINECPGATGVSDLAFARAALQPSDNTEEQPMNDDQIKHMTERFLRWRLPENFSPDAGISFEPRFNVGTPHEMKHEPTGTNLFDATQAEAMVRHMIEGLPDTRGRG